jgi:hypothetical protein
MSLASAKKSGANYRPEFGYSNHDARYLTRRLEASGVDCSNGK